MTDTSRYPVRERKRPSEWWNASNNRNVTGRINAAIINDLVEPGTYAQAMAGPHKEEWRRAMDEEITAQMANGTWELRRPPPGTRLLPCRWVYKVKYNPDGSTERFKARLVAKGYEQREGIDYGELFAPTSRTASLRALLAVAAARNMFVHQLDVSTAFLNGVLKEELWMEQPPGYEGDKTLACKLIKSIYGLKQAPRCWYEKLSGELGKLGFVPSKADSALFVKKDDTGIVLALVHVDDTVVASEDANLVESVKHAIGSCFKIRDLGEARMFLGMEITRKDNGGFVLSQQRYIQSVLEKHGMMDAKPRSTPLPIGYRHCAVSGPEELLANPTEYRALVGELNYLATCTRPDLAFALSMLSRHMAEPSKGALTLALGVLRYLAGTREMGLHFEKGADLLFVGYSDSDWAGDPVTRRSTTGYVYMLGGGTVSWLSQLQRTVAVSSVEAEYQATATAVREALWLQKLADDLSLPKSAVEIRVDSQGALSLGNNPITSARSKHIDVQHHLVRERVNSGEVCLSYCSTEHMVADSLTKALGEVKFQWCRNAMRLG